MNIEIIKDKCGLMLRNKENKNQYYLVNYDLKNVSENKLNRILLFLKED